MSPVRVSVTLAIVAALVGAAGMVLHAGLGPPGTHWTIDNGGKALVLAQVAAGAPALPYPGRAVDPAYRFFPQPTTGSERYAARLAPGMVSQYDSPFVRATAPLHRVFGWAGLAILPALGAAACVFLTGCLALRRTGSGGVAAGAVALAALASPLLFYASVFWEHTLVGALALGGLLQAERGRFTAAGLLLGGACLLREEMVLLLAATLAILAARRARPVELARLAGGGLAGVAALAAFHRATTGSWTGLHVEVNRPVPLVNSAAAADGLLFDAGAAPVPGWVVALVALVVLAVARRGGRAARPLAAGFALTVGVVAAAAWVLFPAGEDAALALIRTNSLLVFVPWALVAAVDGGRLHLADAAVALFVLAFLVAVPERSITGVHPGPRMLLWPLVPILAVRLAARVAEVPRRAWALAPAVAVALAWSVRSLDLLAAKRAHAGELVAAISARPERVVATPLFWLPTELATLWPSRQFHLLESGTALRELATRLRDAGEERVLVAEAPGAAGVTPVATVHSDRFPAFSVDLVVVPLAARAGEGAP